MSQIKLALYALIVEVSAWLQLWVSASTSDLRFLSFMVTHIFASAMLGSLATLVVMRPMAEKSSPRWPAWMLFFCVSAFVPLLGFAGIMVGLVLYPLLPAPEEDNHFQAVALPELDPHERREPDAFRQAGLRSFLRNGRAPVNMRLKALVALQNAPVQFSSPVLRDLLSDGSEDLRLLAYGMLESREKHLNADIHAARLSWQSAPDEASRKASARRLAALYWELIYQGLVQGDLRRHAAEESLSFLEQALSEDSDGGEHLRHGRLLHEMGRLDEAKQAYEKAVELGVPSPRVKPYLAELAFERRDFTEVKRLLAVLKQYPEHARLQPLLELWSLD